jgi:UDP-glucose 4-epimerase
MIERFIDMYNRNRGTQVNIVRVVNAYGPRQLAAEPYGCGKVRKITPAFACRALLGQPIEVYGDGKQVSDMVYVGDVAKALVRATEKAVEGIVFPHPVEVGPSDNKSVGEIAELINEIAGGKSEIVNLPMRPGENVGDRVTADNSTLGLVEMSPLDLVPLEEGMRKTVVYFDEYLQETNQK